VAAGVSWLNSLETFAPLQPFPSEAAHAFMLPDSSYNHRKTSK
jgi:hypothetical protein